MSEIPRRRDFLKLALSAAATAAVPRVLYARGAGALGLAGDRTPANILDDLYAGLQLYWGDLHGHTAYSDGYGAPKLFYDYGGIKNLDFCGVSDHSEWINYFQGTLPMADGSPVPLWKGLVQEVNNRYVPGRFVTFPGYEYTNDQYGHRTIVFANPDQVPDTLASVGDAPDAARPVAVPGAVHGHDHPAPRHPLGLAHGLGLLQPRHGPAGRDLLQVGQRRERVDGL
jgi:hypothetical protein